MVYAKHQGTTLAANFYLVIFLKEITGIIILYIIKKLKKKKKILSLIFCPGRNTFYKVNNLAVEVSVEVAVEVGVLI